MEFLKRNRVRFAPSPTGNVHIGNIRTAIFNFLFARHADGEFLLRVEDTDKERSTQEAIDRLLDCMDWLGLKNDGEIYYQSRHEEEHVAVANKLLSEDKAYFILVGEGEESPVLFRIPWGESRHIRTVGEVELELHPDVSLNIDRGGVKFATVSKKGKPVENFASLAGFRELKVYDTAGNIIFELEKCIDEIIYGETSACLENCSKISFLRREVYFNDLIKGELSKPLDSIKDLVIVRSDGSPVFHLANVHDDIKQGVTHIIRGDDHVENTYRHILLFDAFNAHVPAYAHMPMIINNTGKPYSKRDGDAFVGDFKDKGYLPEALFNYLSLLGWSPGDDREKMSMSEMIEAFTLDRVKSSPAQFDTNKLLNLNGLYMAEVKKDVFLKHVYEEALKQEWGSDFVLEDFRAIAEFMQSRTKLYSQVQEWKYFFFDDSPFFDNSEEEGQKVDLHVKKYEYDLKVVKKLFKKEDIVNAVSLFKTKLEALSEEPDEDDFEKIILSVQQESQLAEGKLHQPLRVAVTGKSSGADLRTVLTLIGKKSITGRLKNFLDAVKEL